MSKTQTDDTPEAEATRRIRQVADEAGFEDEVADLALQIFDTATENDVVNKAPNRRQNGTFRDGNEGYRRAVYPAVVFTAARVRDIPTKAEEVANAAPDECDPDKVTNIYKQIAGAIPFEVEPESVVDWVRRICDELSLNEDFVNVAVELGEDAVDYGLHVGRSTSGFAGAVVFATAKRRKHSVQQQQIADVASVSPTTLRNHYRDVLDLRDDYDGHTAPGDRDAIKAAVDDICDRITGLPEFVRADARVITTGTQHGQQIHDGVIGVDDWWVNETSPKGVAAGIVYLAAKEHRIDVSQIEVAEAANVSKSTVVHRVNDIRDWRDRRAFEDVGDNDLKALAAEHDVDVGDHPDPDRDYLVDRLVQAGVEPEP